jgi:signal transduction histidine kinase
VGAGVTLATALCTWRDLTTMPREASFWGMLISADDSTSWIAPVVITALLVAIPVGCGAWTLARTELAETVLEVDTERRHVVDLTDQLSRQAERERIAREIHDGLGHRLSLLSVHAGALQAVASEGTDGRAADEIRTSAALIRESASDSMDELHHLLDLLRHPDDPDVAAPKVTLADVSRLVDDSVAAGMPLVATVFVEDADSLDPTRAQAAYRVVQELLTNARKHAAGVSVRLSVTGGQRTGSLDIATANHVPRGLAGAGECAPPRGGSGLTGVRERIERLGGTMHSGLDPAGVFRVQIHLPWPS